MHVTFQVALHVTASCDLLPEGRWWSSGLGCVRPHPSSCSLPGVCPSHWSSTASQSCLRWKHHTQRKKQTRSFILTVNLPFKMSVGVGGWAAASEDDEWWFMCRFWCHWYPSTSWLHLPLRYTCPPHPPPWKAIWVLFNSVSHKHQLLLISSVYWSGRQQQSGCFFCFFFYFLISSVKVVGVRATSPTLQDPPPSAPATASTSVATHEAHNLQDVSLLTRVCQTELVSM